MTEPLDTTCKLLALPAELRLRIYEYALAPTGTLCLTATKSKRYATAPVLAPRLLCTCRQIYTEAQDILLLQNRVCFSIDAHDTAWPVVSEKRLPQHVLEQIEHAAIILDAATTFYSAYRNIDWNALTALTALKTLQISIVWQRSVSDTASASWLDFYDLLEEVLQRIPASTKIMYGTKPDSAERDLLQTVAARRQQGRTTGANAVTVQEFTPAEYAELAEVVVGNISQGSQSGGNDDVFAEHREGRYRMFAKTVQPLPRSAIPDFAL